MDLSNLSSTLPPGLADAERDMGDKFRAAALSITNLYKSSLSYTKQAFNVGYSSALTDVLSTVQSSIGAGQDAEQTLSRLMDWAEARQAAISAFAADEVDDPVPPSLARPRPNVQTRPNMSHLSAPARPASAPLPEHIQQQPISTSNPVAGPSSGRGFSEAAKLQSRELMGEGSPDGAGPVVGGLSASTSNSTPNTSIESSTYQPTPAGIMSSSPLCSPSNRHQILNPSSLSKPAKAFPIRYSQAQRGESSTSPSMPFPSSANTPSSMPTSTTFNPVIPHAGVPFVSFTNSSGDGVVPAQNYQTGAKRPLVMDNMMMDVEEAPNSVGPTGPQTTVTPGSTNTPPTGQGGGGGGGGRGGRASKRRSLGTGLGKNEDVEGSEKDRDRERGERERRRGGRRHGAGAGGV
ncbi:hypothetical protein CI109_106676 [Kwoniella shandongensis]|uniref:Uncharacterized protein n=1 Tax=Kwoniella shandongensis TaxID=1734106 RepID=A0A5M6BQS1_9TREE|nr:uncharacterized protein CI109_006414 [Kwoniella shandongensis]KAA5525244.1 hypothetical protein CI109_006414 [Kwoniella shandongensis]